MRTDQSIQETAAREQDAAHPQNVHPLFTEPAHNVSDGLSGSYTSPLRLMISLAVIIAGAEILDMVILQFLPPMSIFTEALIDSAFLLLMISPALYFIFFRPLVRQFIIREQAEQALSQLNAELEKRIARRTKQLQAELDERKRAERMLVEYQKQLRALSSELALVEEREKHRIATSLHDNIGHALAMVNNKLVLLKPAVSSEKDKELLSDIKELVKQSIRYSRSLTSELSSPLLHNNLSFASALGWLAEDILEKSGISVQLRAEDSLRSLADEVRVLFLKAIREILVNIVKHAEARNVEIALRLEEDDIVVTITDDGIGFEMPAEPQFSLTGHHGLGLFTVRERLTHLNGHFSINSKPGQGTRITLTVPRKKDAPGEET